MDYIWNIGIVIRQYFNPVPEKDKEENIVDMDASFYVKKGNYYLLREIQEFDKKGLREVREVKNVVRNGIPTSGGISEETKKEYINDKNSKNWNKSLFSSSQNPPTRQTPIERDMAPKIMFEYYI